MSNFLDGLGLTDVLTRIKNTFVKISDVEPVEPIDIDSTPTQNSSNLVTSGGVKSYVDSSINALDSTADASSGYALQKVIITNGKVSSVTRVSIPTVQTVNDGVLTIKANGTSVGTFSANQSANTSVNIDTKSYWIELT